MYRSAVVALISFGSTLSADTPVSLVTLYGGGIGQANVDGHAFFIGNDDVTGDELWVTDGTVPGTQRLTDLMPGVEGSINPFAYLVPANGRLFFQGRSPAAGWELWRSDGTPWGTQLVKDINPTGDALPFDLTDVDGTLFFDADDGVHGRSLWKSDGTEAGTMLVKPFDATLGWTVAAGGQLFFDVDDGVHGSELWTSDGTESGTRLVKDVLAGPSGSSPGWITAVGSAVVFAASDPAGGLWRSDGTEAGTVRIATLPARPEGLAVLAAEVFFRMNGELWKSNGASAARVSDLGGRQLPQYQSPCAAFGRVFFVADAGGPYGWELWTSDGTAAGTQVLKPGIGDAGVLFGVQLRNLGGAVHFNACEPAFGCEPWVTDGTLAGTRRVADLWPGPPSSDPFNPFGSGPRALFFAHQPAPGSFHLFAMPLAHVPAADFDGDTRIDLVWQSSAGVLEAWAMAGTSRIERRAFAPASAPAGWRVVGSADFTRDGRPDLLWHNLASGRVVLWRLDGLRRTLGAFVDANVDPAWTSVGSSDFDGDGAADVLWWDPAARRLSALLLDGLTAHGLATPTPAAPSDLAWRPVGVGDFNHDGKPDILWRHALSGQLAVWFMDGLLRSSGALLAPAAPAATNWELAALADLDGDGHSDLVWRNLTSQRLVVWYMNGTARRVGLFLTPAQAPAADALLVAPR